jgi:O-antigen ligase
MDTQLRNNQRGSIRVSDAERDQAVAELGEHFQAGRLTLEEFDDRSGLALQARTGSDLVTLFADLPTTVGPAAMTPAGVASQAGYAGYDGPAGYAGPAVTADFGGRRAGGLPVARVVIACVIAAIVLGNVASGVGHHSIGWLVPVVILGLVFLRQCRRR